MKLKFRAEPKDWLIFILFCITILYFVAIAVVNLGTFAKDGTLAGLNPFLAFQSDYLVATLVGFVIVLVAIFMSVSSYFFDVEKGLGVSSAHKKEKGYARWSEPSEMKKELKLVYPMQKTSDAAGIPLINDGKKIWVDDGEYHNLIIGSTGSGKTQMNVFPMVKVLAKKGESMIITDPKGEIYEGTANMLRERGYNIVLLNFRDPQKGNAWNPLTLPYSLHKNGNKDKANELLDDLAMNILYDEKAQNQDPFWEKTSADYFTGLALGLFDDATEEQINLNSINLMTTIGEEKCATSTYVKEYFNTKDPSSPAYINASSTLMSPSDTKGSILAVFKQKIKLFSSRENLSEMLSHSDFDMKEIGRKKTAVFIVIQDEKKTYHSLVTIFIKQCYETLIDVAQESGGKLPYRTNFILDEFANMPPLKDVTTMVTAARSRHIRFSFIIQNFAQLYQVYGKENGETIKGNCGNIIYLISSEIAALEEISKMCGEVKSKEKDKTASTPLVTVSDLQRMKTGDVIILRTRLMPFKTNLVYDYKMDWGEVVQKANYPYREKQAVSLFDIKAFVNKKRDEKINRMMQGVNGDNSGDSNGGMFNPLEVPNKSSLKRPVEQPNDFDIDDLVKRIDAKIAELEEQEKVDQKQTTSNKSISNKSNRDVLNEKNDAKVFDDMEDTNSISNELEFIEDDEFTNKVEGNNNSVNSNASSELPMTINDDELIKEEYDKEKLNEVDNTIESKTSSKLPKKVNDELIKEEYSKEEFNEVDNTIESKTSSKLPKRVNDELIKEEYSKEEFNEVDNAIESKTSSELPERVNNDELVSEEYDKEELNEVEYSNEDVNVIESKTLPKKVNDDELIRTDYDDKKVTIPQPLKPNTPIEEEPTTKVVGVRKEKVTDDQFFDDFFSDE